MYTWTGSLVSGGGHNQLACHEATASAPQFSQALLSRTLMVNVACRYRVRRCSPGIVALEGHRIRVAPLRLDSLQSREAQVRRLADSALWSAVERSAFRYPPATMQAGVCSRHTSSRSLCSTSPAGLAVVCFCLKRNAFRSNRTGLQQPGDCSSLSYSARTGVALTTDLDAEYPAIWSPSYLLPHGPPLNTSLCIRIRTRMSALPRVLQTRCLGSEPTRLVALPMGLGSAQPGLIGT
jgi:hypothetical protein